MVIFDEWRKFINLIFEKKLDLYKFLRIFFMRFLVLVGKGI